MKKNNKIKFKGWLAWYIGLPLYFTFILAIGAALAYYFLGPIPGFSIAGLTLIYFIIAIISYIKGRPGLVAQLVNFATEYGTVQKTLLYEFDIPYALLDGTSRLIWCNEKFTELTGKDKSYHKAICTVFPELTVEYLATNKKGR